MLTACDRSRLARARGSEYPRSDLERTVATTRDGAHSPLCPECRDGKCQNCVERALDENDQWVPCGCPNHGGTA